MVIKSGLERGFRYFKVSPIKSFLDIRHVSVDKVLAFDRSIFSHQIIIISGSAFDIIQKGASE